MMDERAGDIRERVANAAGLILGSFAIETLDDGWLFFRVGGIGNYVPPSMDIDRAAQSILCAAETHFALALARKQDAVLEVPASAIHKVECDE